MANATEKKQEMVESFHQNSVGAVLTVNVTAWDFPKIRKFVELMRGNGNGKDATTKKEPSESGAE